MPPIIEERDQLLPGLQSSLIGLALKALSSYALVWVAAIGGGLMWTFTVLHPETLRIVASIGYALTVLVPILWRDSRGA